jgi:hypothetical protein
VAVQCLPPPGTGVAPISTVNPILKRLEATYAAKGGPTLAGRRAGSLTCDLGASLHALREGLTAYEGLKPPNIGV